MLLKASPDWETPLTALSLSRKGKRKRKYEEMVFIRPRNGNREAV